MNPDEKAVIVKLVEAWQLYLKLDDHESLDDKDFTRGMNRCQSVIACRVARRVDPELWKKLDRQEMVGCASSEGRVHRNVVEAIQYRRDQRASEIRRP